MYICPFWFSTLRLKATVVKAWEAERNSRQVGKGGIWWPMASAKMCTLRSLTLAIVHAIHSTVPKLFELQVSQSWFQYIYHSLEDFSTLHHSLISFKPNFFEPNLTIFDSTKKLMGKLLLIGVISNNWPLW